MPPRACCRISPRLLYCVCRWVNINLIYAFCCRVFAFTRGHLGSLCSILCHLWHRLFEWSSSHALIMIQTWLFFKIKSCGVIGCRVTAVVHHLNKRTTRGRVSPQRDGGQTSSGTREDFPLNRWFWQQPREWSFPWIWGEGGAGRPGSGAALAVSPAGCTQSPLRWTS